jgi:AcrR family transcriptional regulator
MSRRKAELLEAASSYLLKHGVANASLRPMAAELGTSARILMFHFKSKEGLLHEVMQEVHLRLQNSLAALTQPRPPGRRVALLRLFWDWATRAENLPYLRLLYEVQMIALQNPEHYGAYVKKASGDWHDIALQSMADSLKSGSLATLCIAVFDGLLLELMANGEHRRLTRALDEFISMATQHSPKFHSPG